MERAITTTTPLNADPTGRRLTIVVRGATSATAGDLAALPGVASVELESRNGDEITFGVELRRLADLGVLNAISMYARESNLTLVSDRLPGGSGRPQISGQVSVATDVDAVCEGDSGGTANQPPTINS